MDDCIFCKIIKGEIPCAKIYEDDSVFVFVDIAPVNPGHVLVVPKKHSLDIMDMEDEDVKKVFLVAKKISKAVMEAMDADGINVGMNNGNAAGQLVMHSHVHVMPRLKDDGLKLFVGQKYEEGEIEKVKDKIISKLR